jgi:hypothetical protein
MAQEYEDFTMSMFANKEDLYKAKAEYYEKLCKKLEAENKELNDACNSVEW